MPIATIPPGLLAFWFINDDLPLEGRLDYMRRCQAGGIRQLAVHARPGNRVPYGSDEWYQMVGALADEAQRLEMKLWLYDEDPYPSGAAGGLVMAARPDMRSRCIREVRPPADLAPGATWRIGTDRVLWAGWRPLHRDYAAVDLTAQVGVLRADMFTRRWDSRWYYPDTPLYACPRGDVLDMYYALRLPERPQPGGREDWELLALVESYTGSDGPWGSLPDLLHPEAFTLFRDLGLARYDAVVQRHYGDTIPGIFTDEPKFHGGNPLTVDLFSDLGGRLGIDLRAELWRLTGIATSERCLQLRQAYRNWCGERFLSAFLRPYRQWAEARNLLLVGHLSPEDDPIQETHCLPSVMPIMKTMSCAGCDIIVPAVGNSRNPALNLGSVRAGSVRGQLGQPAAVSETLALCDWSVTTRLARQVVTWQKALGIDRIFIHGFFSSADGSIAQEAPPDYGPNSPVFAGMRVLEQWQRRLDAVFDGCSEARSVAILNNMAPYYELPPGALPAGRDGNDPRLQLEIDRSLYWYLLLHCLEAQVPVDIVDAPDLAAATLADGMLTVGKRRYGTILIPPTPFLPADTARALRAAKQEGVTVWGFCVGDAVELQADLTLKRAPRAAESLNVDVDFPDAAWCRAHLPRAVALGGRDAERCFVRRATARDGGDYLLAVNVEDRALRLRLPAGAEGCWHADTVDGELRSDRAGNLAWTLPARGAGLFRLQPGAARPTAGGKAGGRPLELGVPRFERLQANVLRLAAWEVRVGNAKAVHVDYPKPWYELTDRYQSTRSYDSWAGPLPVASTAQGRLRYATGLRLDGRLRARPVLVLDARAARGVLELRLNGKVIGGATAPLPGHAPLRLPLSLKPGVNRLELRVDVGHAMDGLIAPLWIEGDFDVWPGRGRRGLPTLRAAQAAVDATGWQAAGLPYYAGSASYRWDGVDLPAAAELDGWVLVADEVVDSAVLTVNGQVLEGRAWQPYRWALPTLKRRGNRLELRVSSTAGNRLCLDYPAQAQGLIGGARLQQPGPA